MGTEYLIDSNVIIGYLDNKIPLMGTYLLNDVVDNGPIVSIINKIEVLRFQPLNPKYSLFEQFFDASKVLNLDDAVAEKTLQICKAHRIKIPDAVIAATAITYNLVVLTRNMSDFKNIEGLRHLDPWTLI